MITMKQYLNSLEIRLILAVKERIRTTTQIKNYINYIQSSKHDLFYIANKMRQLESLGYVRVKRINYGSGKKLSGRTSLYIGTPIGIKAVEMTLKQKVEINNSQGIIPLYVFQK